MSARKGKVVSSFSQPRSTNREPSHSVSFFSRNCSTRTLLDSTIMALSDYRNSRGRDHQYCINDSEDIGTRNDCGKLRLLTVAPLPNIPSHRRTTVLIDDFSNGTELSELTTFQYCSGVRGRVPLYWQYPNTDGAPEPI